VVDVQSADSGGSGLKKPRTPPRVRKAGLRLQAAGRSFPHGADHGHKTARRLRAIADSSRAVTQ
jgi:hypothetical protein